jgi:hypothetical protein
MGYKEQFQSYMEEVEAYLAKVRKGRRVPAADPQAPQYSQGADDLRLIRQGEAPAGYGQTGRVPAPTAPPSSPPETFDPRGFGQAFATPGGESPKYGFTERPKPETTKVLGGVADSVMNDPRMAAFGGVGALRPRLLQKMAPVPDAGGYRVPTSEMRQMFNMPRPNLRKMDVPTGERGVRSDYVCTGRDRQDQARSTTRVHRRETVV